MAGTGSAGPLIFTETHGSTHHKFIDSLKNAEIDSRTSNNNVNRNNLLLDSRGWPTLGKAHYSWEALEKNWTVSNLILCVPSIIRWHKSCERIRFLLRRPSTKKHALPRRKHDDKIQRQRKKISMHACMHACCFTDTSIIFDVTLQK